MSEKYVTDYGEHLTNVHDREDCQGKFPWDTKYPCPIHNQSDRAKSIGKQHWRNDKGMMERICSHGIGHPDPDDMFADGVHGCDGCCNEKQVATE